MQKQRCHSVQLPEILQVDGLVGFFERVLVPETELLVVGEVRPKFRRRFLLSDNSRPVVAISLSSNHSLRAATVYASTEVGTWLLSFLATSRSNAFARVVLVPVFSLICLPTPDGEELRDRPPSNSHVVSCLSARICIASLNEDQSFVSPEKTISGLSFSSMPLLGAMLVRSAAVELGSGTLSHRNGARPS